MPLLALAAPVFLALVGPAPAPLEDAPLRPFAAELRSATPKAMTLDEAARELERRNPDVESAAASIDDAEAVVRQAMAALLPVVSVGGSYVRNNEQAVIDMSEITDGISEALEGVTGMPVPIAGPSGSTVIQPLQNLTASGGVQVPLFAANAYWDLKAARAAVEAREASREALLVQLRGALVRSAWVVAASEAFLKVAERAVDNAEAYEKTTRNLFEAGQGTRLSVDQAQLLVLRRQTDLAQAQNELARAYLSLGTLLGRGEPVRVVLDDGPVPGLPEDVDAAVAEALGRRVELRAVRASRTAAEKRVTAAKMRAAPTLGASFNASAATVEYPTGLNYGWQAGVTLNWALYDGGFRYGARRQAEAAVRQAAAERRRVEVQISEEVRNAAREYQLAKVRLSLAEQEVGVAANAARSAQRSFGGGQASSLDMLNALDSAFQAELRQEESRARLAAAAAAFQTALGLM